MTMKTTLGGGVSPQEILTAKPRAPSHSRIPQRVRSAVDSGFDLVSIAMGLPYLFAIESIERIAHSERKSPASEGRSPEKVARSSAVSDKMRSVG